MKKEVLKKIFSGFTAVALLINSLIAPLTVYSQEDASVPEDVSVSTDEVTPTPVESPSPTPEEEVTPSPSPEPEPTVEVTPTPTEEITPVPEGEDTNVSNTSVEGSNSEEVIENPTEPIPAVVPLETEEGTLSAVILDQTLAESVSEFDFEVREEGSATLVTDKSDYAPTDTVVIFGSGFTSEQKYTIEITSETGNFKFSDTVTSDESGSLFYSYQLDGTYRPLYLVQAINSEGEIVASATFTDSPPSGCFNDSAGVNDEPGQKDLTKACADYTNIPTSIDVDWNWDEIAWSGANTGDACSLYDTDSDGFANYSLCVSVSGDPATFQNHVLFSCTDTKADRCSGSAIVANTSSCGASVQASDPFLTGDEYPDDTAASCTVNMADVGGTNAVLLDVCSYPSQQPNSDPSDCVFASTENQTGLLEVKKVSPINDTGLFNLYIDSTTYAVDVGNAGTTGEKIVAEGNHTVGETAGTGTSLTDYSTSIECRNSNGAGTVVASGSNAGPLTVDIANNADVVCTITNTRSTGSVVVHKLVDTDGNETYETSDTGANTLGFTWSLDGSGTNAMGSTVSGVNTGLHDVDENNVTDYHFIGWYFTSDTSKTCSNTTDTTLPANISVNNNQTTEITLCNARDTGTLSVLKDVDLNGDGDYTDSNETGATDWLWQANGGSDNNTGDAPISVITGDYALTETSKPDFHFADLSCTGGSLNDNTVTVTTDADVVCTFKNVRDTGTIKVIKDVDPNDNTNWDIDISGPTPNTDTLSDGSDTGVLLSLTGSYTVTESGDTGTDANDYDSSYVCVDGQTPVTSGSGTSATFELSANQDVVCTFTNSIKKGTIIVEKQTNPDQDQAQFTFTGDAAGTISNGQQIEVNDVLPGTYTSTESVLAGWDLTNISCNDTTNGGTVSTGDENTQTATFKVDPEETVICTFTNTKRGHLIVEKVTDPDGDQTVFEITATGSGTITGGGAGSISTSQSFDYEVTPGTYGVSETPLEGWDETENTCQEITVSAGETVTCAFTNQQDANIVVVKETDPDGSQQVFEFSTDYGDNFLLSDGQQNDSGDLNPGVYSVSELTPQGWDLTNVICSDQSDPSSISLEAGETVICTFTNTKLGRVVVTKYHNHDADGIQDEEDEQLSDWDINLGDLTQTTDENGQATFENVLPGNYTLSELIQEGWNQSNIACNEEGEIDNDNEHSTNVNPGDEIRCSIGNYQNGEITGLKWSDENGNGENDEESGLSGWVIFIDENGNGQLDGEEQSVQTGQDGSYELTELTPGTYRVCEGEQEGWSQTYPLNSELNDCHDLEVTSGDAITGIDFGNQEVILGLAIEKSNDKGVAIQGDTITYTLTLENTSNQSVQNISVIDVLPSGFSYVTGSTQINAVAAADPSSSGGVLTWDIGTLAQGEVVTITYQATIADDITAATYENLATCEGEGFSRTEQLLGSVECDPAASSAVRVEVNPEFGGSVGGASVLGISVSSLPAAGSQTGILIYILGGLLSGIILKLGGKKYGKN